MKKIFLFITFLFSSFLVQAQYPWWFSGNNFGKNRIQYEQFEWQYLVTQNFEVYFYGQGLEIAKLAAQYAEADFARTVDMVGYSPYNKIKIFVYHSAVELDQSNIGLSQQDFAIGGQTEFFKPEVEVAFTGHKASFKKNLVRGVTNVLIAQMMYGGNLKERLQSAYLLVLPEWFLSGASNYAAEGWSVELDDYIRDLILNRDINAKKLASLEGKDAERIGQSIWNFIAEEYGAANVASIMNLTRIIRSEENSVRNTLGMEFEEFLEKWKAYYTMQYADVNKTYQKPNERQKLEYNRKNTFYNHVKMQPKGEWIAYTENKKGRYHVRLKNLASKEEKNILSGGYKVINQDFDSNIPLISWKDNQTLAIIDAKKGKNTLWFYKIGDKAKLFKTFNEFEHIEDFDISDDGNTLVMSAENHGKSDIYEYILSSGAVNQLTNDEYDDLNPHYLLNSKDVVFSSNRLNDSLSIRQENVEITDRFNIFIYKNKEKALKRITNTLSNDSKPLPINENQILFLSDQRGITSLFRHEIKDQISTQISNFECSLQNFDFVGTKLSYIVFFKGKDQIFISDFNTDNSYFTPKTVRQQVVDFRQLGNLKSKKKAQNKEKEAPEKVVEEPKIVLVDTLKRNLPADEVDTDNYQFDVISAKPKRKKLLKDYNPLLQFNQNSLNNLFEFGTSKFYETQFGIASTNFYPAIDPLRDWGLVLEGSISDVLENHKVKAGIFNFTNLANSATYIEYEYLKKRLDFRFRADRQSLRKEFQNFAHRYVLNKLSASVTYPLSIASSLRFSPFVASTSFSALSPYVPNVQSIPDQSMYYGGFNAEFVFDNSVVTGLNTMDGIKFKVAYDNYTGIGNNEKSFGNLTVDLRFYKQLGKVFMFASRFSYGTFLGNAKKNYRLGGMSNWISYKEDPLPNKDPLYPNPTAAANDYSDLLFTQYVTGLRGFNYNKLFGNNYLLFNAEIRLSLLPLLSETGYASNFLRNMQFVGFTDVGSCWTGVSPFNRENSLNTVEIEAKPFFAKVSNFKNPFLFSYGAGVRTTVLGYFTKLDVAWGVDDKIVSSAQYYFTLGYDF